MRVALVHDWLTGMRGGERVLEVLASRFPEADLYTLVHVPGSTSPVIERLRIQASPLSRLPGVARHYRKLLPLFPAAISTFRLEGYDLVLSTHHAVAKSVRTTPGTKHLCYCFTPMRYVWDQADAYLGSGMRRLLAAPLLSALRRFDVRTSTPAHVTRFVAISRTVAARIARHYGRGARVVHPPVDVDRVRPNGRPPEDFYLLVGGFVPYKREEIVIDAFRRLGRPLVVAGDGPTRSALAKAAPPNVTFTSRVSDAVLADLFARCRALLYPQEEDFGIVAVEAQAAGRPVIAFAGGGALETVIPFRPDRVEDTSPTGIHFETQSVAAVEAAVLRFEAVETSFSAAAIRRHAEGFAVPRFLDELEGEIARCLAGAPEEPIENAWPVPPEAAGSARERPI